MITGRTNKLSSAVLKLTLAFNSSPGRLFALRMTVSMALLSIPFIIAGKPFYGVTLALGALAAGLSETDDHPRGRIKALSLTVISFFVSSFAVGLLNNHPIWLGAGFILSTILFILLGGTGERYRAITLGSILIGIYAMLGIEISPAWYWQAVLLPAGALFHGLLTLILMYRKPFRLLDEQMSNGFINLSVYLEKKSGLFPSNLKDQQPINQELALLNISVVNSLEKIKDVLNSYGRELNTPEQLRPYLQRFMVLQSLHERAASSHEQHDKLSGEAGSPEVMSAMGEMLRQLSYATRQVGENMLTDTKYQHPLALELISKAIDEKLKTMDTEKAQALRLLHHNLDRSQQALKYLDNAEEGSAVPRLRKDERNPFQRFKALLTFEHPRMRYAIRLSMSFLIGFVIERYFQLDKGAWVMLTSLFVSQITYSETRRRLFQRLLGTASGVVLGVILLQVFTNTAAQVLMMLGSAFAFFYWVRSRYSVAVVFITTFVISAFNLISKDAGLHIMVPRLIDTVIGATIAFIVIRLLWPGWQFRRMPGLISKALLKNMAYLRAITNEYNVHTEDDLEYRIARREAHLADNELALAWNSMRLEPKSKQMSMQQAFTLTYLNHALLSHISALGAHRETSTPDLNEIRTVSNRVMEGLKEAGHYSETGQQGFSSDFTVLLNDLQEQLSASGSGLQKQRLRLLYNIAGTTDKIVRELQSQ
ncbi:FUSC family membrane protein [Saccharicrinis sp. FJH54]|uniref:FUSC family membrane protein n=1 Tax=Saccharicrinis sp. FJH54 TaxID=3344665 RepID=UPI0035D4B5A5